MAGLDFEELNITSQDDDILDEAAGKTASTATPHTHHTHTLLPFTPTGHIQENLEDELVQEALRKVE